MTTTGVAAVLTTPGTQVPVLTLQFTVPSSTSSVVIMTDGEFTSNMATINSEIIVDFDFVVDSVRHAYRRQFLRKDENGGFAPPSIRGQWSFSTLVNALSPGFPHTVTVFASLAGTAPSGGSATVCQGVAGPGCRMNVMILNK